MKTDVLPLVERRQAVRRLVALCHVLNRLVDLAEAESSEAVAAQAHAARDVVRDLVLDLVAPGRKG